MLAQAVPRRDQDDRDALKKRRTITALRPHLRRCATKRPAETAGHGESWANDIESRRRLFFAARIGRKDPGRRTWAEPIDRGPEAKTLLATPAASFNFTSRVTSFSTASTRDEDARHHRHQLNGGFWDRGSAPNPLVKSAMPHLHQAQDISRAKPWHSRPLFCSHRCPSCRESALL